MPQLAQCNRCFESMSAEVHERESHADAATEQYRWPKHDPQRNNTFAQAATSNGNMNSALHNIEGVQNPAANNEPCVPQASKADRYLCSTTADSGVLICCS